MFERVSLSLKFERQCVCERERERKRGEGKRESVFSVLRFSHLGCLQLVGSLKFYVSFAEYPLFYRALLKKRPIILRSLLAEATPCHTKSHTTLDSLRILDERERE